MDYSVTLFTEESFHSTPNQLVVSLISSTNDSWRLCNFTQNLSAPHAYHFLIESEGSPSLKHLKIDQTVPATPYVNLLMANLAEPRNNALKISALFKLLISEALPCFQNLTTPSTVSLCDQIVTEITNSPTSFSTVQDLATKYKVTPNYLSHLISTNYGKTISQLVNEKRLELAERLLMTSTMNLKEVSIECGFSSVHYFCRQFKKFFKSTPKQWRTRSTSILIHNT